LPVVALADMPHVRHVHAPLREGMADAQETEALGSNLGLFMAPWEDRRKTVINGLNAKRQKEILERIKELLSKGKE
jgi:hypothetical protein